MNSRHLFLSKTFWVNILGIAAAVVDILPPKYAAPVLAIVNIGMRVISSGEIKLLPK